MKIKCLLLALMLNFIQASCNFSDEQLNEEKISFEHIKELQMFSLLFFEEDANDLFVDYKPNQISKKDLQIATKNFCRLAKKEEKTHEYQKFRCDKDEFGKFLLNKGLKPKEENSFQIATIYLEDIAKTQDLQNNINDKKAIILKNCKKEWFDLGFNLDDF